MSWAPLLAANSRFGDRASIDLLNNLLIDWNDKNPFLIGPNWICAQEAGFRVLNLLLAKVVLAKHLNTTENFDYLIQFSINYFDNSPSDIINTLKSDNLIHFANFVDIKLIKEKYLLYI